MFSLLKILNLKKVESMCIYFIKSFVMIFHKLYAKLIIFYLKMAECMWIYFIKTRTYGHFILRKGKKHEHFLY